MSKVRISLTQIVSAALIAGAIGLAVSARSADSKVSMTRYERISATLTERGVALLDKSNVDGARSLWEQAVVANPRNATAYSYLGLAAQKAGDKDNAKKYFDLALDIDPDEVHALSWGGQTDLSAADLDGAQAKLQHLARKCGTGCAEYKLLSDSIVSYKSRTSSN